MMARWMGMMLVGLTADAAQVWKFDFGSDRPADGFLRVAADEKFTPETGFGFDLVGQPMEESRGVTGKGGFSFLVTVRPGNYRVTVTLGGVEEASDTTVKAESRRLMVNSLKTEAGSTRQTSFVVNVRNSGIPGGKRVKLKDREKPYLHWDDKLTLEFLGPRPALDRLVIEEASDATTVFLLGDSTVTDQPFAPWNSWGQMLPVFFDDRVAIANHAESGESVRSSLAALRFEQVYRTLKPGDFVMFQFGHNDMKDTRPGALEAYRRNLIEAVVRIRELGGHPVLVTPMERKAGVRGPTLGAYPDTVRNIAAEAEVPLIDLHQTSRILYRGLGSHLGAAFQDGTHHTNFGSYLLACCVADGIAREMPPLALHLKKGLQEFDPAHPMNPESLVIAVSSVSDLAKPDGE